MAINVVNSLLLEEIGLDTVKVNKAMQWDQQIRGAYAFLYTYIKDDFRHIDDCLSCHRQLAMTYLGDSNRKQTHSPMMQPVMMNAIKNMDYSMQPQSKRGGDNVGTYESNA